MILQIFQKLPKNVLMHDGPLPQLRNTRSNIIYQYLKSVSHDSVLMLRCNYEFLFSSNLFVHNDKVTETRRIVNQTKKL